ncbi:MAG: flagellar FliJ family protein [Acidobacteriota bacterium]
MKKFAFPLDRVLAWRRTQVRLEEAKLEQAHTQLRTLQQKIENLAQERDSARLQLFSSHGATGAEFQALEPYRAASEAEGARLTNSLEPARQAITTQVQVVVERRRDVKLLERLREKQVQVWTLAAAVELEQLAEDSYRARSARSREP